MPQSVLFRFYSKKRNTFQMHLRSGKELPYLQPLKKGKRMLEEPANTMWTYAESKFDYYTFIDNESYMCANTSIMIDSTRLAIRTRKDGKSVIDIWDIVKKTIIRTLDIYANPHNYVVFLLSSPNGDRLAVFYSSGAIQILDVDAGTTLSYITAYCHLHFPSNVASWNLDGTKMARACGDDGTIDVLDAASGRIITRGKTERMISDISWKPDGTALATISERDNSVWAWNIADIHGNGQRTMITHQRSEYDLVCVSWHPSGKTILVGLTDGRIGVLSMTPHRTLKHTDKFPSNFVCSISWHPNGVIFACTSWCSNVYICEMKTADDLPTLLYVIPTSALWCRYTHTGDLLIYTRSGAISMYRLVLKDDMIETVTRELNNALDWRDAAKCVLPFLTNPQP